MNVVRNGLGMQKFIRNDVSHNQFEQTVQKLYKQNICDGRFLCISCQVGKVVHLGCPFRLCLWVYVEMISIGQSFTARYAPQTILAPCTK